MNKEWNNDEMILCLAFYKFDNTPTSLDSVRKFRSKLISYTGIDRTEGSIKLRVANYMTCDPDYKGVGMTGGGKKAQGFYDLYASTQEKLNNLRKIYNDFLSSNPIDIPIIDSVNEFKNNDVNNNQIDEVINQIREKVIRKTSVYQRLPKVKEDTLDRAKGRCEICGEPAPFITKEGKPYLEVHHIIALSEEGVDHTSNTVALCPNCHRKMHYAELNKEEEDLIIIKLLEATKSI